MKLLRTVVPAALLLAASILFAQTNADVVADIPFAFVVAGSTLPSGHYIVSKFGNDLNIRDRQNHGVFVPVHASERAEQDNSTRLVFHRYADVYFLSEVWISGTSRGKALFPSKAERKLGESGREREIAVVRAER